MNDIFVCRRINIQAIVTAVEHRTFPDRIIFTVIPCDVYKIAFGVILFSEIWFCAVFM